MKKTLITAKEAAVLMGLPLSSFYRQVLAGKVPFYQVSPGRRRFAVEDLDALLAERYRPVRRRSKTVAA